MKQFVKQFSYFVAIGILLFACSKDEEFTPSASNNIQNQKTEIDARKSTQPTFIEVAQAANLKEINYSNGLYSCIFYGSADVYSIDVITFNEDSLIEYQISTSSQNLNVKIKVLEEKIHFGNNQIVTFNNFGNITISPSQNIFASLTVLVTAHHLLNPFTNSSFSNNGNDDVFPTQNPEERSCFWCTTHTVSDCKFHYQTITTTTTILWGLFEQTTTETVGCP